MLHRLRSFLPHSSVNNTAAYLPLATLSDSNTIKVSSSTTISSSPPTQYRIFKSLLVALLLLTSYFSLSYLYSDPNAWPAPAASRGWPLTRTKEINLLVKISDGRTYRGYLSARRGGGGVAEWKGIKYARAPVEDLRFRRAQPLPAVNGSMVNEVIEANDGDEGCARPVMNTEGVFVGSYMGVEDCLS